MNELFSSSSLFAVALTLGGYELGCLCQRRWKLPIFNPILIGALFIGCAITLMGIPNTAYQQGCKVFSWLLTPCTVCLAIPLYTQFHRLRRNLPAILAGVVAGTMTSLLCIAGLAKLMELDHTLALSLLPKSITTAMGIVVSEMYGGDEAITTVAIIITGVLGSICGPGLCYVLHLTHPSARGAAFGTASHVMGTAKVAEYGEMDKAVGSLSLVVAGILTVIAVPAFIPML